MANVYAERADAREAQNNFFWAKWDKVKAGVALVVGGIFLGIGLIGVLFTKAGNGCQAYADRINIQGEAKKQKGQQILNDSRENWKRKVRSEKVDSDSISITSSEDGEIVDVEA